MSISNQTDKIFGTGDGVTTLFSFPFKIFNASDLNVYKIDTTQTPSVTHGPLILNTDYTVSINLASEGGTVTFTVAPLATWQTLIQRVEPFTQSVVLNTEGNLPAQQIENQLDLMTMLCIQVNEGLSRCPQLPVTFSGSLPLAMPLPQAGLAIGWDPVTLLLTNLAVTGAGTIAVPISNSNLQTLTTAGLVSGASLFNLPLTPSSAGRLPMVNIASGTATGAKFVRDDSTLQVIPSPTTSSVPYVKCSNTQASGTGGGSSTSGSWLTVPLNTKDNDTGAIATLTSNVISLPAGTYRVRAKCPFYASTNANTSAIRIFNNTASAILVVGCGVISNTSNVMLLATLSGLFTLGVTSSVVLQYQVATSTATNGLGNPTSYGTEVYAVVELDKVA